MSGESAVTPARKLHDADVVYLYDGSFEGFLCCVFESFAQHEIPFAVWTPERETATLYPFKDIATDHEKARRVFASFGRKLGAETEYLVTRDFLSGRTRNCSSSGFCIWPLRWGRAPSSGRATRTWPRSMR